MNKDLRFKIKEFEQQKIHLAVDFLTDKHTSAFMVSDLRRTIVAQVFHQKTALASGFNDTIVGKPTIVPQTVLILYHKIVIKSIITCLRGADGSRTRSFCLRDSWSAVSLPPQLTEAAPLCQKLDLKVNYGLDNVRS